MNPLAADVVSGVVVAAVAVFGTMLLEGAVARMRRRRLHHRRANQRFMAGYRAGHQHARRVTVENSSITRRAPVPRPPTPADAGDAPLTPASAGSTRRGRHAA